MKDLIWRVGKREKLRISHEALTEFELLLSAFTFMEKVKNNLG
jgi:hypothetical protein